MSEKPPLAIFSPLPPAASGIATYCVEQLPILARDWDITVVIADDAAEPMPLPVKVCRLAQWTADKVQDLTTPRLYHLGNNLAHRHVFFEALVRPGLAILHDVNLHNLLQASTLARGNFEEYWRLFRAEFGDKSAELSGLWLTGFADERHRISELTWNTSVLEMLQGVIVHSGHAAQEVSRRVPDLPILQVPHHFIPPPGVAGSRQAARARLGIAPDEALIVSAGFAGGYKRIDTALLALGKVKDRLPRFRYVLAGEIADKSHYMRLARRAGIRDRVTSTGFLPLETFQDYIDAADLVLNLRWPTAGESSGVLSRALGAGRCAIVYDFAGFASIPDHVAIKLPVDTRDTHQLEEAIVRVFADQAWRKSIEDAAASYGRSALDLEYCASAISGFMSRHGRPAAMRRDHVSVIDPDDRPLSVQAAANLIGQATQRLDDPDARTYVGTHAKRHAKVASYFPRGGPGMSALELGCFAFFMPLLRHQLGYDRVVGADQTPYPPHVHREERTMVHAEGEDLYPCHLFDLQSNRYPFEDCSFDLILCAAVVEHLGLDPMFMMSEINRLLKLGGVLIIETCNLVSNQSVAASLQGASPYLHNKYQRGRSTDRHNIEYAPGDFRQLVEASGMRVHRFESFDCYDRPETFAPGLLRRWGMPTDMRGEEMLAVGVKVTDQIDRFPPRVYEPGPRIVMPSSRGPWPPGAKPAIRLRAPP